MVIEDADFVLFAKPYYLRLRFSGQILDEGSDANYDVAQGELAVRIKKETEGEDFEDLHLLSKLMAAPKKQTFGSRIEVVGESVEAEADKDNTMDEEQDNNGDDWYYPQQETRPISTSAGSVGSFAYGFNNAMTDSTVDLEQVSYEIVDVQSIHTKSNQQRREERLYKETEKFIDEKDIYLSWLMEDDEVAECLEWRAWWDVEVDMIKEDLGIESFRAATLKELNELETRQSRHILKSRSTIASKALLGLEDKMGFLTLKPETSGSLLNVMGDSLAKGGMNSTSLGLNPSQMFGGGSLRMDHGEEDDESLATVIDERRPMILDVTGTQISPVFVDTPDSTLQKAIMLDSDDSNDLTACSMSSDTESDCSFASTDSDDSDSSTITDNSSLSYALSHPFAPVLPLSLALPDMKTCPSSLTDSETLALLNLPRRSYLVSPDVKENMMHLLVELVYAYAYDMRTTQGEGNIESSWTICKTSAIISSFAVSFPSHISLIIKTKHVLFFLYSQLHDNLIQTLVSVTRRTMVYPYIRHFALSYRCLYDTCVLFSLGLRGLLKVLLYINSRLSKDERTHAVHRVWVEDLVCWIARGGVEEADVRNLSWSVWEEMKDLDKETLDMGVEVVEQQIELTM